MSQDQVLGILRILLPTLLAYLAGRGFISETAIADITAAVITLVAAAWSAWAHTQASNVAKVAALPQSEVKSDQGNISITLHDEALGHVASMNATPLVKK